MRRRTLAVIALFAAGCAPNNQSDLEKSIREEMKSKLDVTITAVELKKQDDGTYAGTATADNGDVYDVTTKPPGGGAIQWHAVLSPASADKRRLAEVERFGREWIEQEFKTTVKSLAMTKKDENRYEGVAETERWMRLNVVAEIEDGQVKWRAAPPPK